MFWKKLKKLNGLMILFLILTYSNALAWTQRYVSSTAGGGGAGTSGDPWTIVEGANTATTGDIVNVKADGTYILAAALAFDDATGTDDNPIMFRGYTTTINDGGVATISGNNGAFNAIDITGGHYILQDLRITDSGLVGIQTSTAADDLWLIRVRVDSCADDGVDLVTTSPSAFINCQFDSNVIGADCNFSITTIWGCGFANNSSHGLLDNSGVTAMSIFDSNGGDGIQVGVDDGSIFHNTIYNSTSDGIQANGTNNETLAIVGNLITNNGGWGILTNTTSTSCYGYGHNDYYLNTSGTVSTTGTVFANFQADVTESATPFTDAPNQDFSLVGSTNAEDGGAPASWF